MAWYCDVAPGHPVHAVYHDTEYGFPTKDERALFERLALEIMQAGLSWEIVLKKREGLNTAFAGFDADAVAAFGARDVARLVADAGIIRNRRKIEAIIANATRLVELRATHGGFAGWLAAHHPLTKSGWTKLFRKTFAFTGEEIVSEFLMSTGYLAGAHRPDCPVHAAILKCHPPWAGAEKSIQSG